MRILLWTALGTVLMFGMRVNAQTSPSRWPVSLQQELNKVDQDLSAMGQILSSLPAKADANIQAKVQIVESIKTYLTAPHIAKIHEMMPSAEIDHYNSAVLAHWIRYQMARASSGLMGMDAKDMLQFTLVTSEEVTATKHQLAELIEEEEKLKKTLASPENKVDEAAALENIDLEIDLTREKLFRQFKQAAKVVLYELKALKESVVPLREMEREVLAQLKKELSAISQEKRNQITLMKKKAALEKKLNSVSS